MTDTHFVGGSRLSLPEHIRSPDPRLFCFPPVFLDFETTNKEYGHARVIQNKIVCAAWAEGGETIQYKRGGEFEQRRLLEAIAKRKYIVAHNAKFELQWLARMGVDTTELLVYDTMLGEYVLAGNRKWPLDLGSVSKRYGGSGKHAIIDAMMKGGVCPSDMPEHLLKERVIKDVSDTRTIFYAQSQKLWDDELMPVMYTRCLFIPVLADLEMNPMHLSTEHVEQATIEAKLEEAQLANEFCELTGGINPRSTKQMAEYVYGTLGFTEIQRRGEPDRNKPSKAFPDGAPKVDNTTLSKLVAKTDAQKNFIALRAKLGKVQAKLSKTLDFFDGVVKQHGARFYGQFNQTVTATHRTSSSGVPVKIIDAEGNEDIRRVQFQNFPSAMKGLIKASAPGRCIAEIDGMQLEFRGAAFLTQDPQAIRDIRDDVDVHRFTASILHKIAEALVTPEQRKKAKTHTFKPLYGGKSGTPDQVRYYEAFQKKYAKLYDVQMSWVYDVLKDGYLRTATGMKFYFPNAKITASGYITDTPSIFNYPIQSFCTADVIPIAVTYLWHRVKRLGLDWTFINTVHDSVEIDLPEGEGTAKLLVDLGLTAFTHDVYFYMKKVYNIDLNVPLGAGFSIGKRWATDLMMETEINVERDGRWWRKGSAQSAGQP